MAQNAFTLLSLPERFALDEENIEAAWRRAIALVHPERRVAEQWAGRINEARDALLNPVSRAVLLLTAAGIDAGRETDTHMPADFLMQQMMWREALEDARGDAAKVASLASDVQAARDELVSALAKSLDDDKDYERARGEVRRLMFVEKLLTEIHRSGAAAPAL